MLPSFFDQQQRKVPHLFLFHLPTQEKERCVIHTVKLLWNNASVIIKLPRSLFIHTACKLKRERCLYKRCMEKKEIIGLMPEGTLSHIGIRLISHILYTPPNHNILASVQGCLINVCIPKRLLISTCKSEKAPIFLYDLFQNVCLISCLDYHGFEF